MTADYSPWTFITYNQVDQGLVEEIIRDNQIDPGINILAVTGNISWYKPPSLGNTSPVITISAPSSGSTYLSGNSVTFKGAATDTEDGILSSSLAWTSSINGSIGSGSTFSTSGLSVGTHTITASVADSSGLIGSDSITITITPPITPPNTPPTVTVAAPANGSSSLSGTSVTFTGTANDTEDGALAGSLAWTSSIDGPIGSGSTFSTSSLSVGTHTITASVTDSGGLSGSDSTTITITSPNTPPTVTITAPSSGSSYIVGKSVTFKATATDTEDGSLSSSQAWTSSIDGPISSGSTFSTKGLSVGSHTITASVTDSGGLSGSDSITVTITSPNTPPTVTITAPSSGSSYMVGKSVTFKGAANDNEDGNLKNSLTWTSSINGPIGSGSTFSTAALSVGTHTITASVTDSGGLTGSESITLTITNTAPVVTVTAPGDGSSYTTGTSVTSTGTANDTEDGDLAGSLTWTSSIDGPIGSGSTFSTAALSVGTHTITASVTDTGGLTGSDSITVTITSPNIPPTVTVSAPTDGIYYTMGASVTFTGSASDAEDGDLAGSLTWTSSINGSIGSNGTFSTTGLSVGTHTITASVTDSGGLTSSDSITVTITPPNTPPTATVTAPTDGSSFAAGASVTFTGSASDAEDGDLAGSLAWTSSIDGSIGSGSTFSTAALSVGTHTITASVTDSGGLSGFDGIIISITSPNTPPTVTVSAPTDGSSYTMGASVTFTGSANDTEDGNLAGSLTWISSINGSIGSNGTFSTTGLSVGTHTITATVTDSGGLTGSDSITVTITLPNTPPTVTVTAPTDGSSYLSGTSVTFTGTANDTEDGDLTGSLTWTSSINGSIGSNGTFSTTSLTVGTHTITASVTDSGGLTSSDSITVTITSPNTPPTVTVTAPTDGSSYLSATSVTFTGTANDTEDGDLTGSLTWTSSIDGPIGSGGTFSTTGLTVGTHTITASVTDSGGLTGSASITVRITSSNTPPTLKITAPGDGSTHLPFTLVNFSGTASDAEDGDLTGSLTWTSSINGAIGSGGTFSTASLLMGTHTITASVTDSGGLTGSDSITITVGISNIPPLVIILSPMNGSTFSSGTSVNFQGWAFDIEDGDLTSSLSWSSSIDGVIGSGGSFSKGLSVGTHTITASVTDSGGLSGSFSITVTITAPVSAPSETNPFAAKTTSVKATNFEEGEPSDTTIIPLESTTSGTQPETSETTSGKATGAGEGEATDTTSSSVESTISETQPETPATNSSEAIRPEESEPTEMASTSVENTTSETELAISETTSGETTGPEEVEPTETASTPVENTTSEAEPETTEITSGESIKPEEGEPTVTASSPIESTTSETELLESASIPVGGNSNESVIP